MALTVGDVMTHNVISTSPQTPVTEAAERLATHRISGLPVVDERGTLVGVVSDFDIIGKNGRTVGEIMTRSVISVSPQTPLEEAAHILTGARIRRLPVLDGAHLVGIVSRADLVRRIATRWTCSVCGSFERGPQPPDRCHTCGATTREFMLEREPAGM